MVGKSGSYSSSLFLSLLLVHHEVNSFLPLHTSRHGALSHFVPQAIKPGNGGMPESPLTGEEDLFLPSFVDN